MNCLRCKQPLLNVESDMVFCGLCLQQAEYDFSYVKERNKLSQLSDVDYSRFIEMKRELKKNAGQRATASFGWARAVLGQVDDLIGRENRITFLKDVFGRVVESSRDLSSAELFSLAMWGRPTKRASGGVLFHPDFIHDLNILQVVYNHQITLPGMEQ